MSVSKRLSRRGFLKTTVAAGAAATLTARNIARAAGANERMTTAYIGCGAYRKVRPPQGASANTGQRRQAQHRGGLRCL